MTSSPLWNRRRRWLPVIAIALLASCGGDAVTGTAPPLLSAVTPVYQLGIVGEPVEFAPTVRVVDARGAPAPGVLVEFTVMAGSIEQTSATTNEKGEASSARWVLGTRPTQQTVRATVSGTTLTFVAIARPGVPARIESWSSREFVALPGEPASGPVVRVTDRFGNEVQGAEVRFTVDPDAGHLNGASSVTLLTGLSGIAQLQTWILSQLPGTRSVTASHGTLPSVTFTAHVLDPTVLEWYELVAIRYGSVEVELDQLSDNGTAQSTLGITRFDHCLCKPEEGMFVERGAIHYGPNTWIIRTGGSYFIQVHGSESGSIMLEGYDPLSGATLEGDRLVLPRWNDDFWLLEEWIFSPRT